MNVVFLAFAYSFHITLDPFLCFWTIMIFASLFWYGFLIFYIGFKGGREIKTMTKTFDKRQEREQES